LRDKYVYGENLSRKGAKAPRRKENPFETRQRFAPLREKNFRARPVRVALHDKYLHEEDSHAKAQRRKALPRF